MHVSSAQGPYGLLLNIYCMWPVQGLPVLGNATLGCVHVSLGDDSELGSPSAFCFK